jgi:hypothetical protein
MKNLDSELARLPREMSLPRDLWPAIEASLPVAPARARSWRMPLALAAGLGITVTAGLIGWHAARLQAPAAGPVLAGEFAEPAGPRFASMRGALEHTYQQRLALLAPATRGRIEQDLATIRAANADLRRALAAYPQSPVLNRLLASTWQQEFDLYSTVVRTTEPIAARKPT